MRRASAGWLAAAASVGLAACQAVAGCSAVLGIEADRHLAAADASGAPGDAGSGAGGATPWGCLLDAGASGTSRPLTVTLIVMDGLQPEVSAGSIDGGSDLVTLSGAYLPGISVRACSLLDPSCAAGSPPVVTDDAGRATFQLTGGFYGFFDLHGSLAGAPGVPVSFYPGRFVEGDEVTGIPAYEFSQDGLRLLASSLTTARLAFGDDAGAGHVLVSAFDCQDHQAAGVSFSYSNSSAQTQSFYMAGGIPNPAGKQTDGYGLGGAINVPAGAQIVSATIADGAASLGTSTVVVRPGSIAWAWFRVRAR
jgi:hypothetical protein